MINHQHVATAGSKEKCEACTRFGANHAINYRDENFETRIAELTSRNGVDVILDMVGAPYFMPNIRSLKLDGRLIEIATQLGNVDAGIYDANGSLLSANGGEASPGTGIQNIGFAPINLVPGIYYIAVASNNSGQAFNRVSGSGTGLGATLFSSNYPLGSKLTISSGSATSNRFWMTAKLWGGIIQ